ncbi:uncharacterized protein PRCAT00000530001 [Priceomyces carsonii]|uniref:uncharacterized protein n=1 Tax=Priceomyces carsonii TaxID=28549 RepID=UPI002ED8DFB7|nr:unnamed protein product [Priceomyces carsonii]
MDAYSEFIEPSRVNQCVGCNFISSSKKHLIVGKGTLLQIFDVAGSSSRSHKSKYKLRLIGQYKLHGLITELVPLRTIEQPKLDYLIVSTKYAKFSVIKWDHFLNSISTVSLHYYENSIQNATFEKLSKTDLIIEPNNNSCTCLRFKNLLTFLPLEVSEDDDELDEDEIDTKKDDHDVPEKFFDSSFMIDAQSLDPNLGDVVDMQFLYNYKEPTLAILSLKARTWAGLLPEVKDNVNLFVLSLDLSSKTSTSILKVENLPFDIDRIIPLQFPLNGSLLMGCNEILHVDNGGIVRRIAVNQFTSSITASTKNYLDQSSLNLKLENCCVTPLPNDTRVLMILSSGIFFYINFEVDGRAIKKIEIEPIEDSKYSSVKLSYPTKAAVLHNNLIFIANKNGNSPLIELSYRENEKGILETEIQNDGDITSVHDDDEDELYDEDETNDTKIIKMGSIDFVLQDEIFSLGPISNFTLGHYSTEKFVSNLANPNFKEISIVCSSGSDQNASLNILTPSIQPKIKSSLSFSQINRMWTVKNKFLITSDDANSKSEIFQVNKRFARLNSKDFINNELTVAIHELNNGKFILQVTPHQIILFSYNFKKRLSLSKEVQNEEIIYSTFSDEFLMIFLSSGEVLIFTINTYNETYSKIDIPKILSDTIITTGYITNSNLLNAVLKDVNLLLNRGSKRKFGERNAPISNSDSSKVLGPKQKTFILVTGDNRIVAFNRFHNEKCYQLNEVDKFTEILNLGFFEPKETYPDPFIKQVVFDELGDWNCKSEYLTILTVGGEVIIYKLFFDGENYKFLREVDLPLTGAPANAYPLGTTIERRLVYISNLNGYTCTLVTGLIPHLIMKSSHSIPRIFKFTKIPAVSFAPYSDSKIDCGLIFLDDKKNARICELPLDFNYDNKWPCKSISIGESIKSVTYSESSNTYIISCFKDIPYDCLDEEGNPVIGIDKEKPSSLSYKGSLKLLSPFNWTVIDSIDFDDNEIGLNVKSMSLDVGLSSKKFKQKKELIVVGTGKYRMEDLSSNGSFKIYQIIDIIPEPDRPETNHKFKEIFQEDTRGAVTSICEVSGRFLVSQGQKIIIRDLQDDGVVPVAFLDTAVYVSEAKSFGNLLILGDSLKSVWLAGFDAEPFRMITLGKDLQSLDVNCADFITKDEDIYILIADNNNVLHLVQYDPEDPTSSNGQRLIQRASFNINSTATCLRSIPKYEEYNQTFQENFQVIGSTVDGSFFAVFPLSESTYRRMYILQQQLTDKEYHYCGLNPRLNRFGGLSFSENDTNSKPLLDHDVIKTFARLSDDRKLNLASKVSSKNIYLDIWKDLIEFENVLKYL